jgi:transposase
VQITREVKKVDRALRSWIATTRLSDEATTIAKRILGALEAMADPRFREPWTRARVMVDIEQLEALVSDNITFPPESTK